MRCTLLLALSVTACAGEFLVPPAAEPVPGQPAGVAAPAPACAPSKSGMRRLNRREFANTVRGLLGTFADDLFERLPLDSRSGRFDTNAQALSVTPDLLERYLDVTDLALERALEGPALLPCQPSAHAATDGCVQRTVRDFAQRAWRGPLDAEALAAVDALTATAVAGTTTFKGLVQWTFAALLASPRFLFLRVDTAAPGSDALDGYGLATRLSYWLTAGPPDAELLARAADGSLTAPSELKAQVRRLMATPAARQATVPFARAWLGLEGLSSKVFDASRFPGATPAFIASALAETQATVLDSFTQPLPIEALLTGTTSFLDDRLAAHYGATQGPFDAARRSALPPGRVGLLGQAAILAATSHPDRTSIPHRGMWVMDVVLCQQPPPAPSDVDTAAFRPSTVGLSQRAQLEQHRAQPSCRGCHAVMDPLGVGLEGFDALGAARSTDNGAAIDARGTLPDGRTFDGAQQLATLLARDNTADFVACLGDRLLSYGTGRLRDAGDVCRDRALREAGVRTVPELLEWVATSEGFLRDATLSERAP